MWWTGTTTARRRWGSALGCGCATRRAPRRRCSRSSVQPRRTRPKAGSPTSRRWGVASWVIGWATWWRSTCPWAPSAIGCWKWDSKVSESPVESRLAKLAQLRARGIDPFGGRYERTAYASEVRADYDRWEGRSVRVAGRLVALRVHGKTTFADLEDPT